MIPNHMHFYWGSDALPELCAFAPISFKLQNPFWDVTVHIPEGRKLNNMDATWNTPEYVLPYNGECYMPFLKEVVGGNPGFNIKEERFPEFMKGCHAVHESDYLRLKLMAEEGGYWSDFDILYKGSMPNIEDDLMVCHDTHTHLIGLYGSVKGHKVFTEALQKAEAAFTSKSYQSIGALLLNEIELPEKYFNMHPRGVYAHHAPGIGITHPENIWLSDWTLDDSVYDNSFDTSHPSYKNITRVNNFGVHWYGGSLTSRFILNGWDEYKTTLAGKNAGVFHNFHEYAKMLGVAR